MKSILFVSTVRSWGGSEILWAETAARLLDNGYKIKFSVRYNTSSVQKLKDKGAYYIGTSRVEKVRDRILMKIKLKKESFLQAILDEKPQLVIINQSTNIDSKYYMNICIQHRIPYVTITQLIANFLWAFYEDETIDELRVGYASSRANYFVSKSNLEQHNIMIGDEHPNSKVVLNPCTVSVDITEEYPPVINGQYQVAMVGRLETFHKGQDLLLQVIRQPKWKDRPITFNIYGTGPYPKLLERLVKRFEITNVVFKGFVQNVAEIWKNNHLLVLPSRMEGQSLALIEAIWCYRGALVTDVGGAKELITDGETGFVAAHASVSDIDNALEKAWRARDKWEEIGRNAGKKIREIYREDPIESFTHEIERVINKANGI